MTYAVAKTLPARSAEVIKQLYERFEGNHWAQDYINTHKPRCYDDVKRVCAINPQAKVLNVGGAPYIFESLARAEGLNVTSLDLDPERHTDVIETFGIEVEKIDIENEAERDRLALADYDVIVLCEVFEHMRHDLIGLLDFLRTAMKDDAVLYLTTPNFFYFRRFMYTLASRRSGPSLVTEWGKLKKLGHMGHVREYSKRELIELFQHAGFKVAGCDVRNRTSEVRKDPKWFLPTLFFTAMERTFDLFGQEFVFVLRK